MSYFTFLIRTCCLICCLTGFNVFAQDSLIVHPPINLELKKEKKNTSQFNIAPYFNYSQGVGVGYGLIPMYSFYPNKKDSISPKSIVGVLGYRTTNESQALTTFGKIFLDEDKWRLAYALGTGRYNFQTYLEDPTDHLEGFFLPYGTSVTGAGFNLKRKLTDKFYLGTGMIYSRLNTDFVNSQILQIDNNLATIMVDGFYDNRDFVFYPKNGSRGLLRLNTLPEFLGNKKSSNVLIGYFNKYVGANHDRDILALRTYARVGLGNISFQQQTALGGLDLRGYSSGKFRGDGKFDVQAEYRWNFLNKLRASLVGFGGLGTIYGSSTPDFDWQLYPSIGAGFRYTAIENTHLNIGVDAAIGKDDWGIYFRFGEAF